MESISGSSCRKEKEYMSRVQDRKERLERTRQMYLERKSEEEIAEVLQVSVSTVRGYISELGVKRRDWNAIRNGIAKMYMDGKEIKEIMDTWKVNQPYISKVVRNYGLSTGRRICMEEDLVDENTVYADNTVILEKVIIPGKPFRQKGQILRVNRIYTDLMPLLGGR